MIAEYLAFAVKGKVIDNMDRVRITSPNKKKNLTFKYIKKFKTLPDNLTKII
tara:strand:- start:1245 stop:1400 length:156 start_codon:yes stop_codon:yes gene_type:complete